jgi:hypothetical protein
MKRSISVSLLSAASVLACVGLATSAKAIDVGPTSVYLWTGHDYGFGVGNAQGALAYNGGATPTWAWQAGSMSSQPWIDASGRIYFGGTIKSSIPTGAIATTTNVVGIFSASTGINNSPDVAPFQNFVTGQTDSGTASGYKYGSGATLTSSGFGTSSNLRTSGSAVGLGALIQNPLGSPAGTGINTSSSTTAGVSILQNNAVLYSGTFASQTFNARASRAVSVPNTNDWTATPSGTSTVMDVTNYQGTLTSQFSDMNSSGTYLAPLTFAATSQPTPGTSYQGANATLGPVGTTFANGLAATTGNNGALALIASGGTTTIIARTGDLPFGVGGPQFANGSNGTSTGNGVGGFFMALNRSGQVAYDAAFLARGNALTSANSTWSAGPGGITTANDSTAWIYTPGSGSAASQNTLVYAESSNVPSHNDLITGGSTSAGSATFTGAISTAGIVKSFSNAGMLYAANGTGGDTVTTSGIANTQFLMISTAAGGLTPTFVQRQNDIAPGFTAASNVHVGGVSTSGMKINNGGTIAYYGQLQSASTAAVQPAVSVQYNQFGDQLITSSGIAGNAGAIFAGTPGITSSTGLKAILRDGDAAPGFGGAYINFSAGSTPSPALNNNGDIVFASGLTSFAAGTVLGVVGQNISTYPVDAYQFANVLWAYNASSYGLVPLLYTNQQIQVETGVFKYVSQFGTGTAGNGDGGTMNLNDNGQLVVWVRLADTFNGTATSTSYIVLQVPAAGTGSLALLGLGAMARRRRR